jgi:hypothetical protein
MPALVSVAQILIGSCMQVPDGQSASVEQKARQDAAGASKLAAQNDPATHMSAPGQAALTASVPSGAHPTTAPAAPQTNVHFSPAPQPVCSTRSHPVAFGPPLEPQPAIDEAAIASKPPSSAAVRIMAPSSPAGGRGRARDSCERCERVSTANGRILGATSADEVTRPRCARSIAAVAVRQPTAPR